MKLAERASEKSSASTKVNKTELIGSLVVRSNQAVLLPRSAKFDTSPVVVHADEAPPEPAVGTAAWCALANHQNPTDQYHCPAAAQSSTPAANSDQACPDPEKVCADFEAEPGMPENQSHITCMHQHACSK
jgi:hypothetical protein